MLYIVQYVAFGIVEGDWLNDWITHCPSWFNHVAMFLYQLFS